MQADKSEITKLLKTARGQIDGILKMVEEDRYCIDISRQLMATEAVINTANRKVLTEHLKGCVKAAETDEEKDEKIEEILKKSADSEETTKLLVDEALANGGKDNITVMVICILSNSRQRALHSKNRFMLPIIGIVAVCIAAGGIGIMKHHKGSNTKYEETDPVNLESV